MEKAKARARYTVRVRSFKGGRMFEIKDGYWDSRRNAFMRSDGSFYSTEECAEKILRAAGSFLQEAQPGKVYQIQTLDYPFGVADRFVEVPVNWFHC